MRTKTKRRGISKESGVNTTKECCALCRLSTNDPDQFGEMVTLKEHKLTVHYFCLLTSSGVYQRGEEDEGIFGFLVDDIKHEISRSSRLTCVVCKRKGASVGCFVKSCRKMVHFPCGKKHQFISQFTDLFQSYCKDHSPTQSFPVSSDLSLPQSCSICLETIEPVLSYSTLKCPVCHTSWFHRDCVQHQAHSAGLFFFRCTLCNNKDTFQEEMLRMGIHIPERDASWELDENAFEDLLEVYQQCDALDCLCINGRSHSAKTGWFEVLRCALCGSRGTHRKCSGLKVDTNNWACEDCTEAVDGKASLVPRVSPQRGGQRRSLLSKRRLSSIHSAVSCKRLSLSGDSSPEEILQALALQLISPETQPQAYPSPQTQPQAYSSPQTQAQAYCSPQTQPQASPSPQASPESSPQHRAKLSPQSHPSPHATIQPQHQPQLQTLSHPQPQTLSHPEPQTLSHPQPQTLSHPEPQTLSCLQPTLPKPQPHIQSQIHSGIQFQLQSPTSLPQYQPLSPLFGLQPQPQFQNLMFCVQQQLSQQAYQFMLFRQLQLLSSQLQPSSQPQPPSQPQSSNQSHSQLQDVSTQPQTRISSFQHQRLISSYFLSRSSEPEPQPSPQPQIDPLPRPQTQGPSLQSPPLSPQTESQADPFPSRLISPQLQPLFCEPEPHPVSPLPSPEPQHPPQAPPEPQHPPQAPPKTQNPPQAPPKRQHRPETPPQTRFSARLRPRHVSQIRRRGLRQLRHQPQTPSPQPKTTPQRQPSPQPKTTPQRQPPPQPKTTPQRQPSPLPKTISQPHPSPQPKTTPSPQLKSTPQPHPSSQLQVQAPSIAVVVSGDQALSAGLALLMRSNFNPTHRLSVRFKDGHKLSFPSCPGGVAAKSYFLKLLVQQIQESVVFEGPPGAKNLALDSHALREDLYFEVGCLLALSLVHGGPPLCFFSPALYQCLFNYPRDTPLTITHITHSHFSQRIRRIAEARSLEDLKETIEAYRECLELAGCNRPISTLEDKHALVEDLVSFTMITRLQLPLQRLREGLRTLGVFEQVQMFPAVFSRLFCGPAERLTAETLAGLFTVSFSEQQDRQDRETPVVSFWRHLLVESEVGRSSIALQDILLFSTGADTVPALGFQPPPSLTFIHPQNPAQERGRQRDAGGLGEKDGVIDVRRPGEERSRARPRDGRKDGDRPREKRRGWLRSRRTEASPPAEEGERDVSPEGEEEERDVSPEGEEGERDVGEGVDRPIEDRGRDEKMEEGVRDGCMEKGLFPQSQPGSNQLSLPVVSSYLAFKSSVEQAISHHNLPRTKNIDLLNNRSATVENERNITEHFGYFLHTT